MVKRIRTALTIACALAACLGAFMTPIRAQEPTQRGPSEGIKVHGHWEMEVRNPDGTLVTRREFENELHSFGKSKLASVLSTLSSRSPT